MFYEAYVENNKDLDNLQRVQVRVLGVHSQDKDDVPTKCLPWARPCLPITSGRVDDGYGDFDVPEIGDWVWIFFRDELKQEPHYFAIMRTNKDGNKTYKQTENQFRKDRWDNETLIDADQEKFEDHFGNRFLANENLVEVENGAKTAKVTIDKDGNVTVFSSNKSGAIIDLGGEKSRSSAVNYTWLDQWMTQMEATLDVIVLAINGHTHTGILGIPTGPGGTGLELTALADVITTLLTTFRKGGPLGLHDKSESAKLQISNHEDK